MLITRKSLFTGVERTLDIDITQEQLNKWEAGVDLIQNVFPNLSADDREFLITGITADEWKNYVSDE